MGTDLGDVAKKNNIFVPIELKIGVKSFHGCWGQIFIVERAQQRVAHSNGWKSRHGKSQSHVAWMAGGDGNVAF